MDLEDKKGKSPDRFKNWSGDFYFNLENPVLWAGSEFEGCALKEITTRQ